MKKSRFSTRKIKILIKNCYFEDLERNGVLIIVWDKHGLLFRSASISSDELWQDTENVIKILSKYSQAKRWFKREMSK